MLKWPPPLRHLDDLSELPHGHNPRLATDAAPEPFRLSLYALSLSTFRFGKMALGPAVGHLEFSLYNLPIQIQKQGFRTADLLPAFVKPRRPPIDRDARSPHDFDLKGAFKRPSNASYESRWPRVE